MRTHGDQRKTRYVDSTPLQGQPNHASYITLRDHPQNTPVTALYAFKRAQKYSIFNHFALNIKILILRQNMILKLGLGNKTSFKMSSSLLKSVH